MTTTCPTCGLTYDDTYRLTFCPHESFQMRTVVAFGGKTRICTSVEELQAFLKGE